MSARVITPAPQPGHLRMNWEAAIKYNDVARLREILELSGITAQEAQITKTIHLSAIPGEYEGDGSPQSPLNASTAERILVILVSLLFTPANFEWGAGVFRLPVINPQTPEESPWWFCNDWHWVGKGKGRTVFKPDGDMEGPRRMLSWRQLPGEQYRVKRGSIRYCTFDGEVTTADIGDLSLKYLDAIALEGDYLVLHEVEVLRCGGAGQEVFPIQLTNGLLDGSAERNCHFAVMNCSADELYCGQNGCCIVVTGQFPDLGSITSIRQHCTIWNNHFTDAYLGCVNFQNLSIIHNFVDAGRAGYACLNIDTRDNKVCRILDNTFIGASYPFGQMGAIRIGNPSFGTFRHIEIGGNFLQCVDTGYVTCGVLFVGGVDHWNLHDNIVDAFYGMLREDAMHPHHIGTQDISATPTGGPGMSPEWVAPKIGRVHPTAGFAWDNINGGGIASGNMNYNGGAQPYGMEDTVRGQLNVTGGIHAGGLIRGAGPIWAHTLIADAGVQAGDEDPPDPYATTWFVSPGFTKAVYPFLNKDGGVLSFWLGRLGGTVSNWFLELPSGNTRLRLRSSTSDEDGSFEFHDDGSFTGLIPDAELTFDRFIPGQGIAWRQGADWPLAADIPDGYGVMWRKGSEVRHAANISGAVHYGQIYNTDPDASSVPENLLRYRVLPEAGTAITLDETNCCDNQPTIIRCTSASAIELTYTPDQPAGRSWAVRTVGAGVATVDPTGCILEGSASTAGPNTTLVIIHAGSNYLMLEGGAP